MTWTIGANMHLRGSELLETIDNSKWRRMIKRTKAMIFLQHQHTWWFER